MKYIKYQPSPILEKYIDFYYVFETEPAFKPIKAPFFADACTDVFINLDGPPATLNDLVPFLPYRIYIGGVATAAAFIHTFPNSVFVGIRFKPGGLYMFYKFPVIGIINQAIEFHDKQLLSIIDTDQQLPQRLDQYFIAKIDNKLRLNPIAEIVHQCEARISVDALARKCNVSNRSLERLSQVQLGLTPKEFISIVRFQRALKSLQKERSNGALTRVASDMGYYDHAHFAREMKKYSGLTPSEIWPGPKFP